MKNNVLFYILIFLYIQLHMAPEISRPVRSSIQSHCPKQFISKKIHSLSGVTIKSIAPYSSPNSFKSCSTLFFISQGGVIVTCGVLVRSYLLQSFFAFCDFCESILQTRCLFPTTVYLTSKSFSIYFCNTIGFSSVVLKFSRCSTPILFV